MNKIKKPTVLALLLCVALLLSLCGCARRSAEPITDINDLGGRRVGVCLAWSADYLLTGREDMKLFRYDNMGGMIMALCYNQVDAVGTDFFGCRLIEAMTTGISAVEPAISEEGYIFYFGSDEEEVCKQYNEFLAEYKLTPAYDEFVERVFAYDGEEYDGIEVPSTGTGRELNVCVLIDAFPTAFLDSETGQIMGLEVELIKLFANAYNYRLNLVPSDYNDGEMGLRYGRYDVMIGQLSELYLQDVEDAGMYGSDSFIRVPLYLMQVTDPDGVQILADLDE